MITTHKHHVIAANVFVLCLIQLHSEWEVKTQVLNSWLMRLRLRPQSSTHAAEAKQTTGFKREDLAARLNEAINLMRQSYQRGKG